MVIVFLVCMIAPGLMCIALYTVSLPQVPDTVTFSLVLIVF